jgi:AcrR family transcriptional regulator
VSSSSSATADETRRSVIVVSASDPVAPLRAGRRTKRATNDADDQATRRAVIDAAIACILERGFYRASSNQIAKRAGVSWGVIQYYFGSREALMLAVLEDGKGRFADVIGEVTIDGVTVAERLDQLLDVLAVLYGTPEYLAYMQITLNMDHDPATSAEVRTTMRVVAERSNDQLRNLLHRALGPAAVVPDLVATTFLALRGFVVSQQLVDTMAYESFPPEAGRTERERRLLSRVLAPYIEQAAAEH